MKMTSIKWC